MTPPNPDEPRLPPADWGHRLIAFLIDTGILFVTIAVSYWTINIDSFFHIFLMFILVPFCAVMICGSLFEGTLGLTPGKAVMKLKVVSASDHNQCIGITRGIFRLIIKSILFHSYILSYLFGVKVSGLFYTMLLLSIMVFALDHLWPLWDKENQALHDKFASSRVVFTARDLS